MQIDKTFKIKEKYFNAIVSGNKTFEFRHKKLKPGSIVKLQCDNGMFLIVKSGRCIRLFDNDWDLIEAFAKICNWYWIDDFVKEYFFQAPTFLIEISYERKMKGKEVIKYDD